MFLPLVLGLASFAVFFKTIFYPFVHDDVIFIVNNPAISHLGNLSELFFPNQVAAGLNSYYRPLLDLFYRLQHYFFGFNPFYFHLTNIVLHTANGLLLFSVLSRLSFHRNFAFVVSILFLIHPVQTEAVACVSGASNLLCALFLLLSLHAYLRGGLIFCLISFVFALLCKEQAIMFVPLVILVDWYRGNKAPKMWMALSAYTFGFFILRGLATHSHLMEDIFRSPGELYLRLLSIPRTILVDLRLIVMPSDLHYYRNTDILGANFLSWVGLFLVVLLVLWMIKQWPELKKNLIFGWGWLLICLFPVLNIVPLINEYSFILTAEHFLYLPMVGFVLVLAVILRRILSQPILTWCSVLIIITFMGISFCQNTFWRGEIPLYERMIAFEDKFARGHLLLAKAYYANHRVSDSIREYGRALEIMQEYEQKAKNIKSKNFYRGYIREIDIDLVTILMEQGRYNDALKYLNQALEINPNDVALLNTMAVCYISLGDPSQAEAILKLALGLNPSYGPARNNLNKLLTSQ